MEYTEEKSYRPYKDIDEFISDFKHKCSEIIGIEELKTALNAMFMPNIWLRFKDEPWENIVITMYCFSTNEVYFDKWYNLQYLFEKLTYLDGSPCGKLE